MKKLKKLLATVAKLIKNQIYFSNNSWRSYIMRYASALFFSGLSLLTSFLLREQSIAFAYLIAMLFVATSAWMGNLGPGIVTAFLTGLGVAVVYHYFEFATLNIYTTLEFAVFILAATTISLIITSAKRVELVSHFNKKEKESQKHIANLEARYNKALEEIKVRDEFMSIASHELKTPLTSTLLKLQIVLYNIRNVSLANFSVQKLLQMLESAESQTKRLAQMINDLLNLSLIKTGKIELELEDVNLKTMTQDIIDRFSEKAEKENVAIKLMGDANPIGKFDRLRMEQVLTNLISNAIKYGEGKEVEIDIAEDNSTAKIQVRDQGIGIPQGQKSKIFELFGRAVKNNHAYKGLGVGLYISNQIVKAHNGTISVESKEGKGSTFTLKLPLGLKNQSSELTRGK